MKINTLGRIVVTGLAAALMTCAAGAGTATAVVKSDDSQRQIPAAWELPTRMVLKNDTNRDLVIGYALNGNSANDDCYQRDLLKGQEVRPVGSNSGRGERDIFVRVYLRNSDGSKGTFVHTVVANNLRIGPPSISVDERSSESACPYAKSEAKFYNSGQANDWKVMNTMRFTADLARFHDRDGMKQLKCVMKEVSTTYLKP